MGEKTPHNLNQRGNAGRFVLLVDTRIQGYSKLLEGLRKRDVAVRVVTDVAQAMVEVAQFKAQVIIVHEPETVTGLEPMLSAIRCYHPGVICWRHEAAREGRRENLSAFACEISTRPSSPRFEPEPAGNPQDQPLPFMIMPRPSTTSQPSSEINGMTSSKTLRQSTLQSTNGHAQTSAHVDHKSIADGQNGHHEQRQGLALARDDAEASDEDKPPTPRRDSLGQRLSIHLDANDDLTAAPLLSAEEIELLRGPVEES